MLSKILSACIVGIESCPVAVEVDIASKGLPFFAMVGLPDAAVKESKERVRAALKNIGLRNYSALPTGACTKSAQ